MRTMSGPGILPKLVLLCVLVLSLGVAASSSDISQHLWKNYMEMPDEAIAAWLDYIDRNPGEVWISGCGVYANVWGVIGIMERFPMHALVYTDPDAYGGIDRACLALRADLQHTTPQTADFSSWGVRGWELHYFTPDGDPVGWCRWTRSVWECRTLGGQPASWEALSALEFVTGAGAVQTGQGEIGVEIGSGAGLAPYQWANWWAMPEVVQQAWVHFLAWTTDDVIFLDFYPPRYATVATWTTGQHVEHLYVTLRRVGVGFEEWKAQLKAAFFELEGDPQPRPLIEVDYSPFIVASLMITYYDVHGERCGYLRWSPALGAWGEGCVPFPIGGE